MLSSTRHIRRMSLCALAPLFLFSCTSPTVQPPTLELLNFRVLEGRVVGGGQVDVQQFQAMARDGYTLVVNLRRAGEPFPKNEAELARQAGLDYRHIPVGGDDLVVDHAYQLADALASNAKGHVLVHCKSGNRVGALWGLHVALRDGLSAEEGLQAARAAGMRSDGLGDCVRAALTDDRAVFGFRTWGSMMEVLRNGQTEGRVNLARMEGDSIIGVGALAQLTGELTIDGGRAHITAVTGSEVTFPEVGPDTQATLLAIADVPEWVEIPLSPVANLGELEGAIAGAAAQQGIDTTAIPALPFRVEGRFEDLCLHVLNGSCPIAHPDGPEPWRLTDAQAEGTLVGFYAENAGGKLTHHGQRSHVHAIVETSAGGEAGGHVDATRIPAGATLFLPQHIQ